MMGVSKDDILYNMQKEVTNAQLNVANEAQLKQHIARITMLCDLLLTSSQQVVEQGHISVEQLDAHMEKTQAKQVVTDDPYDIFDF